MEGLVRIVQIGAPHVEALGEGRRLGPVGVEGEGQSRLHQLPPQGRHMVDGRRHCLLSVLPHPRLGVDPGGVGLGRGPTRKALDEVQGVLHVHLPAAVGVQRHGGRGLAGEQAL